MPSTSKEKRKRSTNEERFEKGALRAQNIFSTILKLASLRIVTEKILIRSQSSFFKYPEGV